jgi:DNA polymerase-3 subunit theta
MKINLAALPQDEMDKVNVDLAAAGVAFKERYNMPIVAEVVEREQPAHLRDWFRERLITHHSPPSISRVYRTNLKLNKLNEPLHFLTLILAG